METITRQAITLTSEAAKRSRSRPDVARRLPKEGTGNRERGRRPVRCAVSEARDRTPGGSADLEPHRHRAGSWRGLDQGGASGVASSLRRKRKGFLVQAVADLMDHPLSVPSFIAMLRHAPTTSSLGDARRMGSENGKQAASEIACTC